MPSHHLFEDNQAIICGTLFVAVGVALVGKAQLITGGIAGLAFLLHYATGISFGKLFFLVNIPFYLLALKRLGKAFVAKTFAAVAMLSAFTEIMPGMLELSHVNPYFAAVLGGLLMGVGMLILFRHRSSLGGLNVLALYLQEKRGWRAGAVQLVFDALILLAAAPMISARAVAISLICAALLNASLIINHRPGRYLPA